MVAAEPVGEPFIWQAPGTESMFALNRKVFKAYLLKESLDRLWTYHYEGAMLNYLRRWIDQLRWQRLRPFQKLAEMLGIIWMAS